jgi:predicted transcriptional regulator of viral defense system
MYLLDFILLHFVTLRMPKAHAKKLLELVKLRGLVRPSDLTALGIPRAYLKLLVDHNELIKIERGLYAESNLAFTENHSLAEIAKRFPQSVICLLSALRFHHLTTENPAEVWIALPKGSRPPRSGKAKLRVLRFSDPMMSEGIEKHVIEGVSVQVYSIAKTVVDCFRFRHRIGVNVAVEALRDAWQSKRTTGDELWRFAKICRVLNVMRPYFDSLP